MMKFIEWLEKNSFNVFFSGLSFALLLMILITQIKIIILSSESVPYKVCVQVYKLKPHKGDLCVFDFHGIRFIKYLIGVEGETIINKGNEIFVNGRSVGKAQRTQILTPIENCIIPKGYVFVAGTHNDSFDSRYKEFGLVNVSNIKGKAFGWIKYKSWHKKH